MAKKARHKLEDTMGRREVLKGALGLGLALATGQVLAESASVVKAGDILVHATGDMAGKPILAKDVPAESLLMAYPMDASSKNINKDRNAMIVLVKLDPKTLDMDTAKHAAEGLVAYSAICTHRGCAVGSLAQGDIVCPCHGSMYDPHHGAKVVGGPAPRALAALPIKLDAGQVVAAGGFIGQVGV